MIETCADHSYVLSKMVYIGSRRWLLLDHRFRKAQIVFDGNVEQHEPPTRLSGHDILLMVEEHVVYLDEGGQDNGEDDPVKMNGVKRVNILNQFPY